MPNRISDAEEEHGGITQRTEQFRGADRVNVKGGKFSATDGGTMMDETKNFTIDKGTFDVSGKGSGLFNKAKGHTIHNGDFNAKDGSTAFTYAEGITILDGTFTATGSIPQPPANYGIPPGPSAITNRPSTNLIHSQSAKDGSVHPHHDRNDPSVGTIHAGTEPSSAPIPPSYSESAKDYFDDKGKEHTLGGKN